jgi:hypothetical protein
MNEKPGTFTCAVTREIGDSAFVKESLKMFTGGNLQNFSPSPKRRYL